MCSETGLRTMNPELLQWSKKDIPKVEKAWLRTLDYARKSRDLCQANGINFLLLFIGSEIEVRYALDPEGTVASLKAMGGPHIQNGLGYTEVCKAYEDLL